MVMFSRISVGSNPVQGKLINRDMITNIMKEHWTGVAQLIFLQATSRKEEGQGRYSRFSVIRQHPSKGGYPKTGVEHVLQ